MLSLRPRILKRYLSIVGLLLKHGGDEWLNPDARTELMTHGTPQEDDNDDSLADDLEARGPTFVKLGQLLSTRPDIVPPQHLEELKRLRNDVEPFDSATARRIVADELGADVDKLYAEFGDKPFAAASLSQVHRARLHDGREVAVKIQRPGIREVMTDDLDALDEIAALLERHYEAARCIELVEVVGHLRRTLMLELDFNNERANLQRFAELLDDYPKLVLPAPVPDLCGSRVLTMDYIDGTSIADLHGVVHTELDGATLADQFFDAYLHQVLVAGSFHADPHPGNLLLTPDRRIAVLDLGMVGRFPANDQRELLKLLLAIAEVEGGRAAQVAIGLGQPTERFDADRFEQLISELVMRHADSRLDQLNVGGILMQICRIATECGLRLPPELALLGKTLLNLDEVGSCLDPEFDPHEAIRRKAADLMQERLQGESLPGQIYTALLETRELVEKLPRQATTILDRVANNELRFRVDAIDQPALLESVRSIANRITAGLVLAALIIGAALLMRIETEFTLFGYPGLAIVLFLLAAGGGFWLAGSILFESRPPGRGR
ncbi:MAG: AarF/ABC1/UbiB kinase family protein [Gammaproteobacteria bacterium]|nr:AarF/ABC1/UbiB kinase family protein [Gammaproteobacteria bacterium]NND60766.1 AarF/ABC1/UbiB kinase family protein [Gammaproteobacteria bacterium]